MSKDKACISAVKEVCQRCHLYKENCGMLDFPDQCSTSGRYIDGYRQAEKDLELTWEDIETIREMANKYCKLHSCEPRFFVYSEILKQFKDFKEK